MKIIEFVEAYKAKSFMKTKQGVEERIEWIKKELGVKEYIPFRTKREIAELVVKQNITVVDGIKTYDSIGGYVSLVVASITAHTCLSFSSDPIEDYDLLAKNGLLEEIIAQFQGSHEEIDLIMHMALDMEMEDNEPNVLIGRFLNKISTLLDDVVKITKDKFEHLDFKNLLGEDIKPEDLAKLTGLLNKLK